MFPYVKLNIKVWSLMQISICMINWADYYLPDHDENIIQLSKLSSHIIQLIICISTNTTSIFLFVILNILNIKRNLHVKCISLHLLLYCQNTIYWERRGGKGKNRRTLNWRTRWTALCTLHIELYVYFILVIMNC